MLNRQNNERRRRAGVCGGGTGQLQRGWRRHRERWHGEAAHRRDAHAPSAVRTHAATAFPGAGRHEHGQPGVRGVV